jgi:4-hydroxy-tetrahydrodipicolinate synthase
MTELTGLFIPLITPFTASGEIAAAPLERLAHRVLDDGATGIVALGTTAEAATLSAAERRTVLDICSRVCRERSVPLIAGAGSNDTAGSARALAALAAWPQVSAALAVVPYYSRPGEAGVREHFTSLAAASPVPLVIYNIPYRTGQQLSWSSLRQLAGQPGIAGVKHSAGSVDADTIAMMAGRPAGFSVLGAILASAHVRTRDFARLVAAWREGAVAAARPLGHELAGVSATLFAEPNPVVIKAVLHQLGEIPTPAVRLPLVAASARAAAAAMAAVLTTEPAGDEVLARQAG